LNSSLQNLFSLTPTQTTSVGSSLSGSSLFGQKSSGANIGDLMFGQLLSAQLQGSKTSSPSSTALGSGQLSTLQSQLQSQITQMLKSGMSLEQIARQLGGSLSSNILAQLQLQGVDVSSLRSSLTKMITQALGPPSNGPPDQTAEQMASSLVQRFTQVANALTTTVSANATGQKQDSLGSSSDANAGGNSAPKAAGILQAALVALQQSATNSSTSSASNAPSTLASLPGGTQVAPPPAPWVPPATNGTDPTSNALALQTNMQAASASVQPQQSTGGPTVTADPSLAMLGTNADTVIGRILARAANVAASQSNASNSSTPSSTNATATLQPQIAVTGVASASGGASGDALSASLMQAMQNAIDSLPQQQKSDSSAQVDGGSSVAGVGGTQTSAMLANAALGGLQPLVTTAASTTQVTAQSQSQPAAQQPPVDPNAVVDQVLQGINMRTLSDGTQTVRMRLVPESLGSVTVNLQVQGSTVNATLVAQTTDVRDALLANQQMLTRSLADAGLKLSGFTVNLANQGQYQQQQNASQPRFGTTRRFVGVTTSADDDSIAAVPSYGPSSSQLAARQWLNALA
jgi:flagellar hook-length control protein FliK